MSAIPLVIGFIVTIIVIVYFGGRIANVAEVRNDQFANLIVLVEDIQQANRQMTNYVVKGE